MLPNLHADLSNWAQKIISFQEQKDFTDKLMNKISINAVPEVYKFHPHYHRLLIFWLHLSIPDIQNKHGS